VFKDKKNNPIIVLLRQKNLFSFSFLLFIS